MPVEKSSLTNEMKGSQDEHHGQPGGHGDLGSAESRVLHGTRNDLDTQLLLPEHQAHGRVQEQRQAVPLSMAVCDVHSRMHDLELEDISLRQWLNVRNRVIDRAECLHIFKQILDIVSGAHSDGMILQNIRPSCFTLSAFNRVSFIESASCSSSGSENSHDSAPMPLGNKPGFEPQDTQDTAQSSAVRDMGQSSGANLPQLSSVMSQTDDCGEATVSDGSQDALHAKMNEANEGENARSGQPSLLKEILLMELTWYTSPEELAGGSISFSSDVYCLGVLLFELFCSFGSESEQQMVMSNLRHRILPPQLLLRWPKEALFCLRLLHPDADARPKLSEVMQSEILDDCKESLEEWQSAVNLKEKITDAELLSDFLMHVQRQKQERVQKLSDAIAFLTSDIRKIHTYQPDTTSNNLIEQPCKSLEHGNALITSAGKTSMLGKHLRQESRKFRERSGIEFRRNYSQKVGQEDLISKRSRLMKNFRKLEQVYFSMRGNPKPLSSACIGKGFGGFSAPEVSVGAECCAQSEDITNGRLGAFFDSFSKFLRFNKFEMKARLKQRDLLNSSNLVCSLGFDRDNQFFATAGINKKIKVFDCDMILAGAADINYPVMEMNGKSKFSCISWNSYTKSQIASSDFDGAVRLWDISRGHSFLELKEHAKRAWSVDFASSDPKLLASGSDDCTMKLWSINEGRSIHTIREHANICCVQFAPQPSNMVALGSADHKIYCYDFRNMRIPCYVMAEHTKAVSNIRFLDPTSLVSASTDNSIKLWDFSLIKGRILKNPVRTYTGHTNVKNFVGLSIADGYIVTGSETNEVFLYHKSLPMPMTCFKFNSADPEMGSDIEDDITQFVSCVCWRGQTRTLVAANSTGNINILELV